MKFKFIKLLGEKEKEKEDTRLERAKNADLITLPDDVVGTNCGNCSFFDAETETCKNPKVMQKVSARMCCSFWDAPGTKREWEPAED